MARYVKKGGTGGGTSWADAMGSFSSAVYNYDGTVHVGRGIYEVSNMEWGDTGGSAANLHIYGHGEVILEGGGNTACFGDPYHDGFDSDYLRFYDITFRNYSGSVFSVTSNSGGLEYLIVKAYRCKFVNCGHIVQPFCGSTNSGNQRYSRLFLEDCICDNIGTICSISATIGGAGPGIIRPKCSFHRNIFYNCNKIITDNGAGTSNVIDSDNMQVEKDSGNIYYNVGTLFESSQYPVRFNGTVWGANEAERGHVDNFYYNVTNYIVDPSGAVTSVSGLQSYVDGREGWSGAYDNCYTTDPLPVTYGPLSNFLSWEKNSPAWSNNTTRAIRFGAIEFSHTMSNNYQSDGTWAIAGVPASGLGTAWAMIDPSNNNIVKVNGGFEGSGILVSPVVDFNNVRKVKKINFVAAEDSPTRVIDSYNVAPGAVGPNKQEVEYRLSNVSFNQNDITIPWSTTLANEDIASSGLYGRYVQVKITQRTDGVGG